VRSTAVDLGIWWGHEIRRLLDLVNLRYLSFMPRDGEVNDCVESNPRIGSE
jgi:hypothetical protein